MILGKIIIFDTPQDVRLKDKMNKIRFLLGLRPQTTMGELTALPQTP